MYDILYEYVSECLSKFPAQVGHHEFYLGILNYLKITLGPSPDKL